LPIYTFEQGRDPSSYYKTADKGGCDLTKQDCEDPNSIEDNYIV